MRPLDDVTLRLGGHDLRVLELSPRRLVAELPEGLAGPWPHAVLEAAGTRTELTGLAAGERCGTGHVVRVLDPGAQARLWALADRLRTRPPAGDEPPHPGVVPERGHYTEAARLARLQWLRDHSGAPLQALGQTRLDPRTLTGNVENLVGAVEVPVGLAGPLLFDGEHARGHVVAPLATTEGALVASVSRGATAITRSGGVQTRVLHQQMVRAPVFELADVRQAGRFVRWLDDHLDEIRAEVGLVSRHARLLRLEPWEAGRLVHVRFCYATGDAAGQNMTTACTWRACQWIVDAVANVPGIDLVYSAIEGNASGDKKVTAANHLGGRGTRVTAECWIDAATLEDVLKTTPEGMLHGHAIGTSGGLQSGIHGYSINASNLVAALFLATGQDVACVHESGAGIFSLDADAGGVRASMVLPSLVLGTVGGGTALPAQHDALAAMGCAGAGRLEKLAEIVCGFALALDLSTQAAVVGGQFADAHERLGRSRPVRWLRARDLGPALLAPMLAESLGVPGLRVTEVAFPEVEMGTSILSELTARGLSGEKLVGLVPLRLRWSGDGRSGALDVVVKAKPLDSEVILEANKVASLCGGELARQYARFRDRTGFKDTHTRELAVYRTREPALRAVLPRTFGVHEDRVREAFLVVMERLDDSAVVLRDTADDPSGWTPDLVDGALRGIAPVHARWLGREQELLGEGWLGRVTTAADVAAMRELWLALAEHNAAAFPEWIDAFTLVRLRDAVAGLERWWREIESLPRTLVHGDFNPRNIALRRDDHRLVAYDWELATLHLPQRDLAELLAFVLPPDVDAARVDRHVEAHRRAVEEAAGEPLDPAVWRRGYELALRDFVLTRLQLYLMGHVQREYRFLERVVATAKRLLDVEAERDALAGGEVLEDAVEGLVDGQAGAVDPVDGDGGGQGVERARVDSP